MSLGESYFDHYQRHLGSPSARRVFEGNPKCPTIQILSYADSIPGCMLFATLGLSHYADKIGIAAEVILPVTEAWDDIPTILGNSLFLLIQKDIKLGRGTLIGDVDSVCPAFVQEFRKNTVYFTNPFNVPSGFETVTCGGMTGRVLLAMLISDPERAFIRKAGIHRFEEILQAYDIDPYDIRRTHCPGLTAP